MTTIVFDSFKKEIEVINKLSFYLIYKYNNDIELLYYCMPEEKKKFYKLLIVKK